MKTDYEEIKSYAHYMFGRNLKQYNGIMSALDLLSSTYAKGFDSVEAAKKIIRNEVITEKRRLIGRIQQRHIISMSGYEKQCNMCHETKPAAEFRLIVDKQIGYTYFESYCHRCERGRQRAQYAKSTKIRESSHNRYIRFRDKKKLKSA